MIKVAAILAISVVTLGLFWAVLKFDRAGGIAIDEYGAFTSPEYALKEKLQGRRFWEDQLVNVDREIAENISFSDGMKQVGDWSRQRLILEYEFDRSIGTAFGGERSPGAESAAQLRLQAEIVESHERDDFVHSLASDRGEQLRRLRALVVQRLLGAN